MHVISFKKKMSGMFSMIVVFCVLFLLQGPNLISAAPLIIAEDGATDAIVCVDEGAMIDGEREWERRAAEDIVNYIELMTGARPALVQDPDAVQDALQGDAPTFIVGKLALETDDAAREAIESASVGNTVLRADAIAVRRDGNRIYIAGANDDSHYYAAAWLLNEWGVRWYLPSEFGEVVPEREKLTIEELDHVWSPPFEVRSISWRWNAPRDDQPEFTRRNFKNWASVGSGHRLGSYVEDIVPEGKTHWNVPLSDPATAAHVADQIEERYARGEHIGMGMQDGTYESEYERDEELRANLYDKYFQTQALTDPFMVFYNQLAAELMERHPEADGTIGFLAYVNITIPPQREFYAEQPLIAQLAPIDIDPNHGMDDYRSPPRQEYREMMYRWAEIMDGRVQIYDYDQGMLVWRDLPNPSHQAFRQDVQHYRDAGVLGFCTESRGSFATVFTNLHIRGQLMWDPDTDVDALLDEFYEKFYGPASAPMADYWNALFQKWEDTIVTEHEYYVIPAIYTEELVEELRSYLEEGQSAVSGLRERGKDELSRNERLYLERMDFTELSFNLIDQYTEMVRASATRGDYAAAAEAGRRALETRVKLAEMNRNFTTRIVGTASPDDPAEPGGGPHGSAVRCSNISISNIKLTEPTASWLKCCRWSGLTGATPTIPDWRRVLRESRQT